MLGNAIEQHLRFDLMTYGQLHKTFLLSVHTYRDFMFVCIASRVGVPGWSNVNSGLHIGCIAGKNKMSHSDDKPTKNVHSEGESVRIYIEAVQYASYHEQDELLLMHES